MTIIEKYEERARSINSLVCVGLDSDYDRLPQQFQGADLPQFAFNRWIIDQTHPFASAYKPNIAFYEARGQQGIEELRLTIEYLNANHPDILTICDAKRADIGNTNRGYVTGILDTLNFDAVTLHPYLGREALQPFLDRTDKACIILCRTSNPGAGEIQDLIADSKPIWQHVAEKVASEWNVNNNCLLVVGATYPHELATVRQIVGDMTLLIPGIGAQGGNVKAVMRAGQNQHGLGMVISASRSIIFSADPAAATQQLRDTINQSR